MCAFYRLVIPLQNIFHDFYLLFVTLPVTIWTWAEVTCKYAKLLWCRDDVQLGDTIMDNTIISINYCVAFQYIIKQFTTLNIPYL